MKDRYGLHDIGTRIELLNVLGGRLLVAVGVRFGVVLLLASRTTHFLFN